MHSGLRLKRSRLCLSYAGGAHKRQLEYDGCTYSTTGDSRNGQITDQTQGADSNQPTLAWAILLLAHRQDIQKKAYQAVKDAGILSLPSSAYAATNVAYIDALTKEISRYFTVLKLALPKATDIDVEWQGATVPANTLVYLNSWAINRGKPSLSLNY